MANLRNNVCLQFASFIWERDDDVVVLLHFCSIFYGFSFVFRRQIFSCVEM